jgi:AbrB family looped-hinge helix DNA binding protein
MTRVTSKGQVTIPKDIRDKLGIGPGSEIGFHEEGGQVILETEKPQPTEDAAAKMVRVMIEFGKSAKRIPISDNELMELTRGPSGNADAD